jgi:hypothetical protein
MNDERNKKKPSHNDLEVVIKGINYKIGTDSSEELKQMGIKSITKFSNNEEFNIIKAEIIDESTLNKIIKDGLFIGYKRLKVEKFIQPVKITQCFNCQKFGHYSINCKVKEATCVKCGGKHQLKDCKAPKAKCANCGNEHTSSYGGCTYKQTQIKEKIEKNNMKSTNNLLKSYSSVITGNQINASEEKFKSISDEISGISDLVNRINSNLEKKINEVLDKQIIEITDSIKKSFATALETKLKTMTDIIEQTITLKTNDVQTTIMKEVNKAFTGIKTQQVTFQIDLFRLLWPKNKLSDQQILGIIESASRNFNIKLEFNNIKTYVDSIYV